MNHAEYHRLSRTGWLRAAVLGANDGIISLASLMMGVAATGSSTQQLLTTGTAGLIAGSLAMAAGEYVSVQSQADTEQADIRKERAELHADPAHELAELKGIYISRGLDAATAAAVAQQLTAHDALGAHLRDELGLTEALQARPAQAALASALAFAVGAAVPLGLAYLALRLNTNVSSTLAAGALCSLAVLGAASSQAGGASPLRGATRVVLWGALAMAATHIIGHWLGVAIA